jgi:hypothetical protein
MLTTETPGAIAWSRFKQMLEGMPPEILQAHDRS